MTTDERPPIWTGHLGPLEVADLDRAVDFYRTLGLRVAFQRDWAAAMELRGGTHVVLVKGDGTSPPPNGVRPAPFDFMVEDLPATRARLIDAGLDPEPIESLENHDRFRLLDPDGHQLSVFDSHVVGPV